MYSGTSKNKGHLAYSETSNKGLQKRQQLQRNYLLYRKSPLNEDNLSTKVSPEGVHVLIERNHPFRRSKKYNSELQPIREVSSLRGYPLYIGRYVVVA